MTISQIPDGLPTLSHGHHYRASEGACVMEYISILGGGKFTDAPPGVLAELRIAAYHVNDNAKSDEQRNEALLHLIPELMGTCFNPELCAEKNPDGICQTICLYADEYKELHDDLYRVFHAAEGLADRIHKANNRMMDAYRKRQNILINSGAIDHSMYSRTVHSYFEMRRERVKERTWAIWNKALNDMLAVIRPYRKTEPVWPDMPVIVDATKLVSVGG